MKSHNYCIYTCKICGIRELHTHTHRVHNLLAKTYTTTYEVRTAAASEWKYGILYLNGVVPQAADDLVVIVLKAVDSLAVLAVALYSS